MSVSSEKTERGSLVGRRKKRVYQEPKGLGVKCEHKYKHISESERDGFGEGIN